jgi:hypothetical protein
VICLPPRAPGDSVRPRRLAGVVARPLSFTVRVPVNPYHYVASLRLKHPTLDLSQEAACLGLAPERYWTRGMPKTTVGGDARPGVYESSYWTAPLMGGAKLLSTDRSLEEALDAIATQLAPQRALLSRLRSSGGTCECFVGLFADANFGIELSVSLMQALTDIGLDLSIDAYP